MSEEKPPEQGQPEEPIAKLPKAAAAEAETAYESEFTKSHGVQFYITAKQFDLLKQSAARAGTRPNDFARMILLNHLIKMEVKS